MYAWWTRVRSFDKTLSLFFFRNAHTRLRRGAALVNGDIRLGILYFFFLDPITNVRFRSPLFDEAHHRYLLKEVNVCSIVNLKYI